MSTPDINTTDSDAITLESVFKAMTHWRDHKSDYPGSGIPDEIWLKIFQLEGDLYSSTTLRRIFSLSSTQYKIKKEQLIPSPSQQNTAPVPTHEPLPPPDQSTDFCEALIIPQAAQSVPPLTEAASEQQAAVSSLKSTRDAPSDYLDPTTLIVECIRPDGQRLHIHTTQQSLTAVMGAFYQLGLHT